MPEKRKCPVCGRQFTPPPKRKNQVYCSPDCGYIGRKKTKEEAGKKRVDKFIEDLLDMEIQDVLEGRMEVGTNNRMTVKGARTWESGETEYIVLVVRK